MPAKSVSPKTVYEASDVADFCATDIATIYTWVKKGEIPFFKTPGGRLRFKRDVVLDFLRRFHFPVPHELLEARARVVVVDDDAAWLTQLKRTLGQAFDVSTYQDPYDALMAIGRDRPQGVVLDVRMPALDGLRCIERIRAREELADTTVVIFSAFLDQRDECLQAGAAGFIHKPATGELFHRLRQLLTAATPKTPSLPVEAPSP